MATTQQAHSSESTREFPIEGGPSGATFAGAAFAIVAEGVGFHFYLASRSELLAWAFTASNAAILIWFWRAYKALAHRALRVSESRVDLALGQVIRLAFPRSSITAVNVATWRSVPAVASHYINAAKPLEPNVTILLDPPAQAKLPMGMTRRVSRVDLRVPEPNAVIAELTRGTIAAIASVQIQR